MKGGYRWVGCKRLLYLRVGSQTVFWKSQEAKAIASNSNSWQSPVFYQSRQGTRPLFQLGNDAWQEWIKTYNAPPVSFVIYCCINMHTSQWQVKPEPVINKSRDEQTYRECKLHPAKKYHPPHSNQVESNKGIHLNHTLLLSRKQNSKSRNSIVLWNDGFCTAASSHQRAIYRSSVCAFTGQNSEWTSLFKCS